MLNSSISFKEGLSTLKAKFMSHGHLFRREILTCSQLDITSTCCKFSLTPENWTQNSSLVVLSSEVWHHWRYYLLHESLIQGHICSLRYISNKSLMVHTSKTTRELVLKLISQKQLITWCLSQCVCCYLYAQTGRPISETRTITLELKK